MDQTNTKAIFYPETNNNYDFCYVSLVNPFVLSQSHRYGKQLNFHVWDMRKYMLMVEQIFIPISVTSLLSQLSYVVHTSGIVSYCLTDGALLKVFFFFHRVALRKNFDTLSHVILNRYKSFASEVKQVKA